MALHVDTQSAVSFAYDDHFHVGWWRVYGLGGYPQWDASFARFLRSAARPFAVVVVVPPDVGETSAEERALMAKFADEVFERGGVTGVVMLGRGFRAVIQRSVATTLSLFIKGGRSFLIADSLEGLVQKLPSGLSEHHAELRAVYAAAEEHVGPPKGSGASSTSPAARARAP